MRMNELALDDKIRQKMLWRIDDPYEMDDMEKLDMMSEFKIIFPEYAGELAHIFPKYSRELARGKIDMAEVRRRFLELWDKTGTIPSSGFFRLAKRIKILFPEHFGILQEEHEANVGAWDVALKKLISKAQSGNAWSRVIELAAEFAILFPGRIDELNLDTAILKQNYGRLQLLLEENDQKPINNGLLAELAVNLRLIQAQEVRVTDRGIELIDAKPDEFKRPVPPVPETLNY